MYMTSLKNFKLFRKLITYNLCQNRYRLYEKHNRTIFGYVDVDILVSSITE